MKNRQEYRVGTGASLMRMIVVVLMLAVLGMLAFSSAQAGRRQIDRNVRSVTAYYEADARAERALAQLDALGEEAADVLAADGIALAREGDAWTYAVRVDDQRELHVRARLTESGVQVESWQVVRTDDWSPDGSLQLLDAVGF